MKNQTIEDFIYSQALKYTTITFTTTAIASALAQKYLPIYQRRSTPIKVFILFYGGVSGFAWGGEQAIQTFRNFDNKQESQESTSNLQLKNIALSKLLENRYSIIGGVWAASMINPYLTLSQKLIHARLYAQAATLLGVLSGAGLELMFPERSHIEKENQDWLPEEFKVKKSFISTPKTLFCLKQDIVTFHIFPSILDSPSLPLSVIIPAYNERNRLPLMLEEASLHLKGKQYEIIIVDDGSQDDTTDVAFKTAKRLNLSNFKVLKLHRNCGKGGAVTQGILIAQGQQILFADADGATRFSDLQKLQKEIDEKEAIAIGSRAHLVNTEAVVKRSLLRNFLMYSFHALLNVLGIGKIKDTQCGFKLFSREAAARIFTQVHVTGWIFDIEVLLLAEYCKIPVYEVAVQWHEVEDSKMSLARDSVVMALDLLRIRANYVFGIWQVQAHS